MGLAAFNVDPTSTSVLHLGFAFSPSQRSSIPLVIRRLLTSPRRAAASRPRPSRTTPRTKRTGHLEHPRRPPWIRPAPFLAHPPRLPDGPLMDIGLRHVMLARPDRPALYAQPTPTPRAKARHVFLGSRFRLRLPSHPASRRRSCHRLVVGAINLHRGLAPPSCWSCQAYMIAGHSPAPIRSRLRPPDSPPDEQESQILCLSRNQRDPPKFLRAAGRRVRPAQARGSSVGGERCCRRDPAAFLRGISVNGRSGRGLRPEGKPAKERRSVAAQLCPEPRPDAGSAVPRSMRPGPECRLALARPDRRVTLNRRATAGCAGSHARSLATGRGQDRRRGRSVRAPAPR